MRLVQGQMGIVLANHAEIDATLMVDHGWAPDGVSRDLIHRERFGLARGYAYRCRRTIAIAAIMPKGIRMKSAMRVPIAKPLASGERPGGTATNRVSQSSSFMVP